jgi:hypothetical protein
MESKELTFWLLLAMVFAVSIFPSIKILKRMGYSEWWSLCCLFPPLLFVMVWVLAFKHWPTKKIQSKPNVLEGEYIPARSSTRQSSLKDTVAGGFGCLLMIAFLGYGLTVLAIGWIGIEEELGWWWAFGAATLAILLRFTLPITIGAIFGAMNLWGWHWAFATLFALPGLAFMIPALVAAIIAGFSKR